MNATPRRFPQVPLAQVPASPGRASRAPAKWPRVLNVSRDRSVAETRSDIMKEAGFRVETVFAAGDAAHLLQEKEYEAVIVGHNLSREQKAQVIGAARAAAGAPWIIGLYTLGPFEAVGTHFAVDVHEGPQAIVEAVRRVSYKTQRAARRPKAERR